MAFRNNLVTSITNTTTTTNTPPVLSKEKFKELIQSVEKIGMDWFGELDQINKDIIEVQRLSQTYPNVNQQMLTVTSELTMKQKEITNRMNVLHTMLWNIRHQATNYQYQTK